MAFNLAFTNVNITPYVDEIKNLSTNTTFQSFAPFTDVIGRDIFFTLIFALIGVGIHLGSKQNSTYTIAYFFGVTVFCAVLMSVFAVTFFGIITAFLGGGQLYKALVKKSQ